MNAPTIDWNREWSGVSSSLIVLAIAGCLFVGALWLTAIQHHHATLPERPAPVLAIAPRPPAPPIEVQSRRLVAASLSEFTHTTTMSPPRSRR